MNTTTYDVLRYVAQAFALSCQFYGALRIGERRLTRKAFLLLVVGLILAAAFAFDEYRSISLMSQASKVIHEKPPLREIPPHWGENLAPEQKALSIILAHAAFHDYGKIIEYVNQDGKRTLFAPTEKDVQDRGEMLTATARFDTLSSLTLSVEYRWLTTTIAMLFFGVAAGIMARSNAKD